MTYSIRRPAETRQTFEQFQTHVPELTMLGWDDLRRSGVGSLLPHTHQGAYEICYIVRGSADWWAGEEIYEIGPGDVYVVKPDEPHGGIDSLLHACELYWLTVKLPKRGSLTGLTPEESQTISKRYEKLSIRQFSGNLEIHHSFYRLMMEHIQPSAYAGIQARAVFHQLLACVLQAADQARTQKNLRQHTVPQVAKAQQWMQQHISEDYAIERAAATVKLSVTHFHELFRRETGYAPGEWRNRLRIKHARQLLRHSELSITQITMRCGFSSSQYFATAFRKIVGFTPSDYREKSK